MDGTSTATGSRLPGFRLSTGGSALATGSTGLTGLAITTGAMKDAPGFSIDTRTGFSTATGPSTTRGLSTTATAGRTTTPGLSITTGASTATGFATVVAGFSTAMVVFSIGAEVVNTTSALGAGRTVRVMDGTSNLSVGALTGLSTTTGTPGIVHSIKFTTADLDNRGSTYIAASKRFTVPADGSAN